MRTGSERFLRDDGACESAAARACAFLWSFVRSLEPSNAI